MTHIGAYPSYGAPDSPEAVPVVEGLAASPLVSGLEVPYVHGAVALPAARVPAAWRHVVTLIPATMAALGADPRHGLASTDAEGRADALRLARQVRDVVAARKDVAAVEIHSAPRNGSVAAFTESLAEVAAWDWGGADLVVEHCDAWTVAHPVDKGFLTVEAELAAVAAVQGAATRVRVGVNWARSAIEARNAAGGAQHVQAAAAQGLLGALMFSSVATEPCALGPAWADVHVAPAGTSGAPAGSLLTAELVAQTKAAAGAYDGVLGLKIGLLPAGLPPVERVARLLAIAEIVAA